MISEMQNENGVTLTELIIVVTIIGILAVALGFEFTGWQGRYRIESQVRDMHSDLMTAKARAMQRGRAHFVRVNQNSYQIWEDTNEDGVFDTGDTPFWSTVKTVRYDFMWKSMFSMSRRGLVSPEASVRVNVGTNTPDYDCVSLTTTRIFVGKWGTFCSE